MLLPVLLLGVFVASNAAAQKRGRVITVTPIQIVGRVERPIAAVDISRIEPRLTLHELRRPFLDRIEKPLSNGTF
jgi:hypothetical protein